MATRPKVLLLDEPFGALDAKVREVELTRERYEALSLSAGEVVYVTPKGLKVFVGTYAI